MYDLSLSEQSPHVRVNGWCRFCWASSQCRLPPTDLTTKHGAPSSATVRLSISNRRVLNVSIPPTRVAPSRQVTDESDQRLTLEACQWFSPFGFLGNDTQHIVFAQSFLHVGHALSSFTACWEVSTKVRTDAVLPAARKRHGGSFTLRDHVSDAALETKMKV